MKSIHRSGTRRFAFVTDVCESLDEAGWPLKAGVAATLLARDLAAVIPVQPW
jgi:hypothetical protein